MQTLVHVQSPMTTASVARRLEKSEGTIRAWVRAGRLQPMAVTDSGVKLFDPAEIDRLARERGR
jgi:DNA-binding transcriptional MerR regulator